MLSSSGSRDGLGTAETVQWKLSSLDHLKPWKRCSRGVAVALLQPWLLDWRLSLPLKNQEQVLNTDQLSEREREWVSLNVSDGYG